VGLKDAQGVVIGVIAGRELASVGPGRSSPNARSDELPLSGEGTM
jgi:hypothetical protein